MSTARILGAWHRPVIIMEILRPERSGVLLSRRASKVLSMLKERTRGKVTTGCTTTVNLTMPTTFGGCFREQEGSRLQLRN